MKMLNYGSLNIDYVFRVEEIVRPGQTIDAYRVSRFPGGKGMNQSLALARAGFPVYHAGVIGTDGLFLKEMLEKDGVDCRYLEVREDIGTGSAFIQVDRHGQNCIVLNGGANRANTVEDCRRVLRDFGAGDWLLLQNEISCVDQLIRLASEKGIRVILNPSPMNDEVMQYDLSLVSLFLMNEDEGMQITGAGDPEKILSVMAEKYPESEVILTLGEKGSLWSDGTRVVRQAACPVRAVDTTGAGDTFTGYALAYLAQGAPIERSLAAAAKASAIAVTRPGAASAIPCRAEVEAAARIVW